jgi:hypothetical protein
MGNSKKRFGKKGIAAGFSWLFLFWRFVMMCFVAIALVVLVKSYIVVEINVQETHANLFMHNVLYAPEGLSHYDADLERVYPGIIPVSSFDTGSDLGNLLDSRMDYGEEAIIGAELTLFTVEGENLGKVYYNEEWYERWIVVAKTLWGGKGSSTEFFHNKTILLLYDDGKKEPGVLQFSIVLPNSY